MSTKITISHDDKTHVFQECGENDAIYIRVDEGGHATTIRLGAEHLLSLLRSCSYEKLVSQASLNDETIKRHVEETVAARMRATGVGKIFGMEVYGMTDNCFSKQVLNGMAHYKKKRDELAKLLEKVDSRRCQPFTLGLEELL